MTSESSMFFFPAITLCLPFQQPRICFSNSDEIFRRWKSDAFPSTAAHKRSTTVDLFLSQFRRLVQRCFEVVQLGRVADRCQRPRVQNGEAATEGRHIRWMQSGCNSLVNCYFTNHIKHLERRKFEMFEVIDNVPEIFNPWLELFLRLKNLKRGPPSVCLNRFYCWKVFMVICVQCGSHKW